MPPIESAHKSRLKGLFLLLPSAAFLGAAAYMTPDDKGYGTHQQLGLPPCPFKSTTGYPCMTCHMTTSFTHASHGNWLTSLSLQPAGFLFAICVALGFLLGLWMVIWGTPLSVIFPKKIRNILGVCGVTILLCSWGYTLTRTYVEYQSKSVGVAPPENSQ